MYSILSNLLSDKKGGEIFICFGLWHFVYIFLTVALFAALFILFKGKKQNYANID